MELHVNHPTASAAPTDTIRPLWSGALWAWATIIGGLVAYFGTGHLFGFTRDSDIRSLAEAMWLPVVVFAAPMVALTFGVMLPWFVLCRRAGILARRGPALLAGVIASVPTFVAFFLAGRLLPRRNPATLLEDIQAVAARPQRLPVLLALFAAAGLVFALRVSRGGTLAPFAPRR